jgi:hypothetical protein
MRHLFNSTSAPLGNIIQENDTNHVDQPEKMSNDTPCNVEEIFQDEKFAISHDRVKTYIDNLTASEALILLRKCIIETLSTSIPTSLQNPHKSMRTWGKLQGVLVHSTVLAKHEGHTKYPMEALYKRRKGRKITTTILQENKLQLLS